MIPGGPLHTRGEGLCTGERYMECGGQRSCHLTSLSWGLEGGHQGAWLPVEGGSAKGTCASGSVEGVGLESGVA